MKSFIPLSVPNLQGNELKYVTHAVETEWVSTAGSYVTEFEKKSAEYVKVSDAVACQSGTAGLHVALISQGVTKEDEVIVPVLTFIAAVNPVRYIGAEPVFMDCDDSLCIDIDKVKQFCEKECTFSDGKLINNITGKHIKAIVVVHVFGNMTDMEKLIEICRRYNIKIIEDATEAMGTFYTEGKFKGLAAGTIGDAGVYSFNGNKIMTTGGGGMIVSVNEETLKLCRHLTTQAKVDEMYSVHDMVGYNYRMTNIQAALGLAQLEQLESFIETKKENFKYYQEKIKEIRGLKLMPFRSNIRPNYWFYSLKILPEYPLNRYELIKMLKDNNIQTRPVWDLICKQKPYLSNQKYQIQKAPEYLKQIINIPCSSNLTKKEIDYVIECLKKN
jgi:aminotransferase in exopolysaccharide biosynthesis